MNESKTTKFGRCVDTKWSMLIHTAGALEELWAHCVVMRDCNTISTHDKLVQVIIRQLVIARNYLGGECGLNCAALVQELQLAGAPAERTDGSLFEVESFECPQALLAYAICHRAERHLLGYMTTLSPREIKYRQAENLHAYLNRLAHVFEAIARGDIFNFVK
jgi:cob(I)alamin adenosyltransferase